MSALVAFLLVSGALFMLLAGVGLVRLPDLYTRMSATSNRRRSPLWEGAALAVAVVAAVGWWLVTRDGNGGGGGTTVLRPR